MNYIEQVNDKDVTVVTMEFNETNVVDINTFSHNGAFLTYSIMRNGITISDTYSTWGTLKSQQLWQSYFNNIMTLSAVEIEANNRSIPYAGKTQDQLAKDIIQADCAAHSTPYLLG